ncbi:hypothetical protein T36_1989 [Helicobacter cinaedi]|nr:hypothetical protein [Helicobacter cinaedi]BDB65510.1 hypothetical protein T36_1989 [Helicobacter cinaedi]
MNILVAFFSASGITKEVALVRLLPLCLAQRLSQNCLCLSLLLSLVSLL